MLGPCRADMHEGWSESGRAESEIDPGIYKFEAISRKMIWTYDSDGRAIDSEHIIK